MESGGERLKGSLRMAEQPIGKLQRDAHGAYATYVCGGCGRLEVERARLRLPHRPGEYTLFVRGERRHSHSDGPGASVTQVAIVYILQDRPVP